MKNKKRSIPYHLRGSGFSIVELMVAVLVLAILMALAIPNISDWISKARVRASVETLQNGIRLAQSEAAKRNHLVDFSLVATKPPLADSSGFNNDVPIDNGTSMVVRVLPAAGESATNKLLLQGNVLSEKGILLTGGGNKQLVFAGMGQVYSQVPSVSDPAPFLQATRVYRIVSAEGKYPMCVYVRPGGSVRWCDPASNSGELMCPAGVSCPLLLPSSPSP